MNCHNKAVKLILLKADDKFEYNEGNVNGKFTTWDAVVGAARSKDYSVVQSDFYEYIETIATDTSFRQQYNSWYDNMKNISDASIQKSFFEIEKGFTQYGIEPLDSYVVDDGWIDYQNSFWGFNGKFPNELYNSSLQVGQLGSNFGLWLGPRGGYGTQTAIANYIARNNFGSVNAQSGNDINVSDARYLTKLDKEIFCGYQDKFDINYWKLDGMLLEPSTEQSPYYVTGKPLYTISETYERWTDVFEDMRKNREGKDLWLNMTSYTNPSPWHLQWVNSVWMQNSGDTGYTNKFGATTEQQMLTYRDNCYYNFLNDRQWQLPNKYFYNHDPVYGISATDCPSYPGSSGDVISYTTDEMRNHLYMLGTRGTAFWEYYYSYSMFDDDKWQVNAEAAKWIEENFDILQKSKMFGGRPADGDVYGYSCWNGNEGIVSIRNPKNVTQTYELKYDRLIGVSEGLSNVYGKVVVGDQKWQTNDALDYGETVSYTLEPQEVLILQFGAKDEEAPKILSVEGNGTKVEVEFDETIRKPKKEMFQADGYEVTAAELKADRRTVALTLDKGIKDGRSIEVRVDGVQDTVGNKVSASCENDVFDEGIVTSIVKRELNGTAINKGSIRSVDGHGEFSVTGTIQTQSKGVDIVSQGDSYKVAIDSEGYLTFTFNGMTANSKYTQKTVNGDTVDSTVKGMIADGQEHQFSAVKEKNGMLKLYLDGKAVASAYEKEKANPEIEKGDIIFADGLTGETSYITVLDRALAYDEVLELVGGETNVVLAKDNPKVNVTTWDVTSDSEARLNPDMPAGNVNDGVKSLSNYFELTDTSVPVAQARNHSRYIQFDLGDEYDLTRLHMTRYWDGNRTYGPTVIALSKDETFTEDEVVYNSDKEGTVHNMGKGTDDLYQETSAGKEILLEEITKARYIRVYVNGRINNQGTADHIVEFEAYAKEKGDSIVRPEDLTLNSVKITSEIPAEMKVGDTADAAAVWYPSDAQNVTVEWTSSKPEVAEIDKATGKIKAVGEGKTEIKVTAKQEDVVVTDVVEITVAKDKEEVPELGKVTIVVDKTVVEVGNTIKAKISPEIEGVTYTWTSDNEAVATVDKNGVITAVSPGTANITVVVVKGDKTEKASVQITVKAKESNPNNQPSSPSSGSSNQNGQPKTGDAGNPLMLIFFGLISVTAVLAVGRKRVRR